MAGIKSESVVGFIPESVADFLRNQQLVGKSCCATRFSCGECLAAARRRQSRRIVSHFWGSVSFGFAIEFDISGFRPLASLARASTDQIRLELGEAA
jgi:hypothetical protein